MNEPSASQPEEPSYIQKWKIAARAEYDAGLQRLRDSQGVSGPITERDEWIYRFAFRISWAHAVDLVSAVESGAFKKDFRAAPEELST